MQADDDEDDDDDCVSSAYRPNSESCNAPRTPNKVRKMLFRADRVIVSTAAP